jgi:hypothetical protein
VTAWYFRTGVVSRLLAGRAQAGSHPGADVLFGNIALATAARSARLLLQADLADGDSDRGGGAESARATTVTLGNAGGIAIPWLQGRVLVGAGATQGVGVTAVLCAVMFAIVAVFRARRPSVGVVQVGDRLA